MIKKPKNELSMILLTKRFERNISQRAMAKDIKISYPVYSGIERGTYVPSFKLLARIAKYLKMDLREVIDLYLK